MSIRLDASVQIDTLVPLQAVNKSLLQLLDGFDAVDWHRPTIHKNRSVKDLAAHLLHGSIRRVFSRRKDPELAQLFREIGYQPPVGRKVSSREDLTQLIQDDNRAFMDCMSGVKPGIIRELIARYDPALVAIFEQLEPRAPGLGVVWAGEWQSQNWFDIAREYTEKWHHQQQLRDATNRPPLYESALLVPALDTFARGLPFAYRDLSAPANTTISISIESPPGLAWTIRRSDDAWSLWQDLEDKPTTSISVSADLIWRLWTKGATPADARRHFKISGSPSHAEPLLNFVATMA